jgi:hypothetical protein
MLDDILTPGVRRMMTENGWTMADLLRSIRPGGPQDTTQYSAHCTKCGIEMVRTSRQLIDGPCPCECGGQIDTSDWVRWLQAFLAGDLKTTQSIKNVRFIELNPGDES